MAGKTVVISGGTDGMGRAVALARLAAGDRVTVIGSNPAKGTALAADHPGLHFIRADLSSVAENERVMSHLFARHTAIDALVLTANRVHPRRIGTADGLEATFALYYLSRYLLSHRLSPLLDAAAEPVVINVAGVGTTAGRIHWEDQQLLRGYGQVRAQLQAGRANDLLGAGFRGRARYVLYHPGFTRSGTGNHPSAVVRTALTVLARVAARPVADSVAPILGWIDHPPREQLTAVDRGRPVPPGLKTLDPEDAARLFAYTEGLL